MSSSENESSSDEGRQQNGSKSKSSNDSCFKNEVEIKNDMESLRKCPSLLTVEELTSPDYEAWIFATPGRLEAEKLRNLEFNLSKSTKLNIDNEKYETLIQSKSVMNTFLLPDKNGAVKTISREMMGTISLVKDFKLKISKSETTNLPAKKGIDPPTGLKRRHPLYGDELDDVLAEAKGEKRPKPTQTKDLKKLKKPKQEIIEDKNQHQVKGKKKKNKQNN